MAPSESTSPDVSVVIATHGRAALVPAAVTSILDQDFDDFELLVVDDGSTDRTPEVLADLAARDPRIRVLRNERPLGPGAARNRGIDAARGRFVAILDDDDRALPHRLRTQRTVLRDRPDVGLVYSAVRWVDGDGVSFGEWPAVAVQGEFPADPPSAFRLLYLDSNKITNTSLMVRRRALGGLRYAEDLRVGEDWLLFLKLAARGVPMVAIADPLTLMRRDPQHVSLMAAKERAFTDQRRALRQVRTWLDAEGIDRFGDLHRRAWSNQLCREARFWWGIRGLGLVTRALATSPTSSTAWSTAGWLLGRVGDKLARLPARLLGGRGGGGP
ncbi:MAG: glycosyltransferase family A protein [Acidobacteriota bacterium]